MPRLQTVPHTVHLFNFLGEVDDVAQYQEIIIKRCYCPLKEGSTSSNSGKKKQDDATLYIFEYRSLVTDTSGNPLTYLPHAEWDALESKSGFWTLHPNGKDFFRRTDLADRVIITSFAYRNCGSRRLRHFEVHGT